MAQYIRRFTAPLALTLLLGGVACADKEDTAAIDTSLNRDLALAGDTTLQPQLTDVPAPVATDPAPAASTPSASSGSTPSRSTSRPSTSTRRPSGSSGSTSGGTKSGGTSGGSTASASVPAGTQLTFANAGETVCTNTKSVGDTFTMSLSDPAGGASSGTATFRVTESKGARNANERPVLTLSVVSMTLNGRTRSPSASVAANVDVTVDESKSTVAKNVGAGAAIGAVAGKVLGGSGKATAVGAAAGAAAGAARAAQTADRKGCLRNAVVTLSESFTL
jgi:hypothetical protein